MSAVIILNSSNVVKGSPNAFKYKFPKQQRFEQGDEITLVKCSIYNCVFNISASRGNNTFSIKWIDGVNANFIIPDGYYAISDINYFIANCMVNKNWYTMSSPTASTTTIYIYLTADTTGYGSTFTFSPLPIVGSIGTIVKPSGATWDFPATSICPSITLCSGLQTLLGFTANPTLPYSLTVNAPQTIFSNSTPIVSPIDTYILTCSLIDNADLSPHPNAFFSIPLGATAFGEQIQVQNTFAVFNNIFAGSYDSFNVEVLDQNYEPVNLIDKEVVFQFMFRFKSQK